MNSRPIDQTKPSGDPSDAAEQRIVIYSNGYCFWNGALRSRAGLGAVIVDMSSQSISLQALPLGAITDQQADILACILPLETLKEPARVEVFSSSGYLIDTMLGRNAMDDDQTYWHRLIAACFGHHLTWNPPPGRSDNLFSETAYLLSRTAAEAPADIQEHSLERIRSLLLNGRPSKQTLRKIQSCLKPVSARDNSSQGSKKECPPVDDRPGTAGSFSRPFLQRKSEDPAHESR